MIPHILQIYCDPIDGVRWASYAPIGNARKYRKYGYTFSGVFTVSARRSIAELIIDRAKGVNAPVWLRFFSRMGLGREKWKISLYHDSKHPPHTLSGTDWVIASRGKYRIRLCRFQLERALGRKTPPKYPFSVYVKFQKKRPKEVI